MRVFQVLLRVFGVVVVGIALAHLLFGQSTYFGGGEVNATMESDLRFYSVLFAAYGAAFIWTAADVVGRARAIDARIPAERKNSFNSTSYANTDDTKNGVPDSSPIDSRHCGQDLASTSNGRTDLAAGNCVYRTHHLLFVMASEHSVNDRVCTTDLRWNPLRQDPGEVGLPS